MYERELDVIIPSVYVNEHITETKYNIMTYYGGSIPYVVTMVLNTLLDDIRTTRFKSWWPKDEEILEHIDHHNPGTYDIFYNAWNLVSASGKDERMIPWESLERIYRNLFIVLWRLYLNVSWNIAQYCFNVAFSETGGTTNNFTLELIGVAIDHTNQITLARIKINEY